MLVKITTNFGIVNGTRQWVKAAANEEYLENVNLGNYKNFHNKICFSKIYESSQNSYNRL
jgi:hypothetical protein